MTKINTRRLVETALMLAIALILSIIKLFKMPWGGAITLCSMLPIVFISYRYGVKWGTFSSLVYALLQILLDLSELRGISTITLLGSLWFDYLLGFGILGIGGLFRNKIKNSAVALAAGSAIASLGRYLCSFLSGFILWGSYAESTLQGFGDQVAHTILDNFSGWQLSAVYSAIYNGAYMLPELIITFIVSLIIGSVPALAVRQNTK